ncbi:cell division protein ZipA [Oceanisphaera psychrotolerans]|uniref:Cell division protein ZipA n=1 Tax=Oceanisphaera psychrotolerans TaxID=1414654 RepID=A0A1J4QDV9_9GAMM|nr:cell division protein ZipA [Oceanisphaera psychrotolerans]OIN10423.1 cell division protein ZipA [Oceanisphaera psychrotolerans]
MQDLRIILIILGAVAIAALLIHGLWTSQKGRQKPMREKPIGKMMNETAANGGVDPDDFDRDGIGRVRVVGARKAESRRQRVEDDDDWPATPHFTAVNDDDEEDEPSIGLTPAAPPSPVRPVATARAEPKPRVHETEAQLRERRYRQGEIDPLFDEPATPAPVADIVKPSYVPEPEPELAPEPAYEVAPEPEPVPVPAAPPREVVKTWQDVYVINLVARPNQQLAGRDLIRALTDTGFCFGDMDIFHRHQTANGQGEVLFSLINMVKPGTFNPSAMAEFSTPGISIFMQLPRPGMAKNHFNLMVQTAENMAEDLDALLLDAERAPLSPDYLAHCREQLRNYDSQAQ